MHASRNGVCLQQEHVLMQAALHTLSGPRRATTLTLGESRPAQVSALLPLMYTVHTLLILVAVSLLSKPFSLPI